MDYTNIPEEYVVDALCKLISENQPKVSHMSMKRYFEMMAAKKALNALLKQNEETECTVNLFPATCSGSLRAEFENLEVCNMQMLLDVLKWADNFEIYPLLNGRVRIAFMFYSLLERVE